MNKAPENRRTIEGRLARVKAEGKSGQWAAVELEITKNEKNPSSVGGKVVCTGVVFPRDVGLIYRVVGDPYEHTYRETKTWQLEVVEWHPIEDKTEKGVTELLVRECPNVQESRAKMLVNKFGQNAIDQLASLDTNDLYQATGLPVAVIDDIQKWAKDNLKSSKVKERLYGIGLLPGQVAKIMSRFGNQAASRLKPECFTLTEIDGIGFLTVCKIADCLGIPKDRPDRIQAGILYYLKDLCKQGGHTCIEHQDLVRTVSGALEVSQSKVIDQAKSMISNGKIATDRQDPAQFSRYPELFNGEVNDSTSTSTVDVAPETTHALHVSSSESTVDPTNEDF